MHLGLHDTHLNPMASTLYTPVRPTIILSPSSSRAHRPLPPTPAPVPPSGQVVSEEEHIKVQLSRPKRNTFILTWASTIEPGSPAAPSPENDVEHVVSLFAVRWRWQWLNEYTSNEARKKRGEGER